jgi:hypothetical protein
MELAPCHPSGAENSEVDARLLENLWTPGLLYSNKERWGKTRLQSKSRHYRGKYLQRLRTKPETCARIVGVLVEIRSGQLPNTRQKRHSLIITECIAVACITTSISHGCPSTLYHHTFLIPPLYARFALSWTATSSACSMPPHSRKPSDVTTQFFSDLPHKREPTEQQGEKPWNIGVLLRTDMPDGLRTLFTI